MPSSGLDVLAHERLHAPPRVGPGLGELGLLGFLLRGASHHARSGYPPDFGGAPPSSRALLPTATPAGSRPVAGARVLQERSPSRPRSVRLPPPGITLSTLDGVGVTTIRGASATSRVRSPRRGGDLTVARGQLCDFPLALKSSFRCLDSGAVMRCSGSCREISRSAPHRGAPSSAMTGGCGTRLAPTPSEWRHLVGSRRASWRILHLTQFHGGASLGAAPSRAARCRRAE
jgi:hypothetical protein